MSCHPRLASALLRLRPLAYGLAVALAVLAGIVMPHQLDAQEYCNPNVETCFESGWVRITPSSGEHAYGTQVPVSIEWCSFEGTLDPDNLEIYFSDIDVRSAFAFSPGSMDICNDYGTSDGTITISAANHMLASMPTTNGEISGGAQFSLPPLVVVTPDAEPVRLESGSAHSFVFTLVNPRQQSEQFDLSLTCNGVASCVDTLAHRTIGSQDTIHVKVIFSVAGTVGGTGTVTLSAVDATPEPPNNNSGSVNVVLAPSGITTVRGACLALPAAAGVYECGDLRLAHAFPSVRTLSTTRAPTLLYNSQHAEPYPLLGTDVTLDVSLPDSVRASLTINGQTYTRAWHKSAWGTVGQTRQVAVGFDASGLATGVYPFTLEIRRVTGGGSTLEKTVTGRLPIVNRATSPFGAGWWLAGYEQIIGTAGGASVLWVGGDGSAREFTRTATVGTTSHYIAPNFGFPDTLRYDSGTSTWTRPLPGSGKVLFNSSGLHTSTVNRLGFTTSFTHTGALLREITVPPTGSNLSFVFAYDTVVSTSKPRLKTVTVPDSASGVVRTTALHLSTALRIDSIADPGLPVVSFTYSGSDLRVTGRRDRRGGNGSARVPPFTSGEHRMHRHGNDDETSDVQSRLTRRRAEAAVQELEREFHVLVRLAAMASMRRSGSAFYTDERFIDWLDTELRSRHRAGEGWSRAKVDEVAMQIEANVEAARLRVVRAAGPPPSERASIAGTVAQVRALAMYEGAAPDLDLSAAAGVGRELWDEPCERWIKLPRELPRGEYLALQVSGDSMTPLFHPGDTVLVRLRAEVQPETVVVARHPEDGYLIKRVERVTSAWIELASLNPEYPPVRIPRSANAVLGRVMLRWCPHDDVRSAG